MLLSVFAASVVTGFSVNSVSVFGCMCCYDLTPPKIHKVWHYPAMPEYEDRVLILAYITDAKSGVANATLSYSVNTREKINITMNKTCDLYTAEIPPQPYNATVTYLIYAYDNAGNTAKTSEGYYTVKVVPGAGFPFYWLLLVILLILGGILPTAYYFRLRKRR